MMVKFENDDRALYSIIKWIVVTVPTDPAEKGLAEAALYLLLLDLSGSVWQLQQELLGNV